MACLERPDAEVEAEMLRENGSLAEAIRRVKEGNERMKGEIRRVEEGKERLIA